MQTSLDFLPSCFLEGPRTHTTGWPGGRYATTWPRGYGHRRAGARGRVCGGCACVLGWCGSKLDPVRQPVSVAPRRQSGRHPIESCPHASLCPNQPCPPPLPVPKTHQVNVDPRTIHPKATKKGAQCYHINLPPPTRFHPTMPTQPNPTHPPFPHPPPKTTDHARSRENTAAAPRHAPRHPVILRLPALALG